MAPQLFWRFRKRSAYPHFVGEKPTCRSGSFINTTNVQVRFTAKVDSRSFHPWLSASFTAAMPLLSPPPERTRIARRERSVPSFRISINAPSSVSGLPTRTASAIFQPVFSSSFARSSSVVAAPCIRNACISGIGFRLSGIGFRESVVGFRLIDGDWYCRVKEQFSLSSSLRISSLQLTTDY